MSEDFKASMWMIVAFFGLSYGYAFIYCGIIDLKDYHIPKPGHSVFISTNTFMGFEECVVMTKRYPGIQYERE